MLRQGRTVTAHILAMLWVWDMVTLHRPDPTEAMGETQPGGRYGPGAQCQTPQHPHTGLRNQASHGPSLRQWERWEAAGCLAPPAPSPEGPDSKRGACVTKERERESTNSGTGLQEGQTAPQMFNTCVFYNISYKNVLI